MSTGSRLEARQLETPTDLREEIAAMFADVQSRNPQTVLIIARTGNDLVLRMAGNITDVIHLYAHGAEEIERLLRHSMEVASGSLNG